MRGVMSFILTLLIALVVASFLYFTIKYFHHRGFLESYIREKYYPNSKKRGKYSPARLAADGSLFRKRYPEDKQYCKLRRQHNWHFFLMIVSLPVGIPLFFVPSIIYSVFEELIF